MVVRSEKNRIKTLVTDTITLLCRNGLQTTSGFSIDGVIGVTSLDDEDDVFLISIKEVIKNIPEKASSESESEEEDTSHKRKRKRPKKAVGSDNEHIPSQDRPSSRDTFSPASAAAIKQEIASDSDSNDLVMVKEEPSRHRQFQATQVPQSEAHAINSAINNIASLSQVQSYQPPTLHQVPNIAPQMPTWQNSPRPRALPPTTLSQLAQQQQAAMQGYVQMKRMYTAQPSEDFSRYTEDDMRIIANRVASSEGMFLTVRLVKRRVCRYPTNFIIKTMKEFMTKPPDDPQYMGEYREPPRTKVFYKCPPEIIKPAALQMLGVSLATYKEMFHNVPKVQKWDKPEIQGRLLMSVIEASPFNNFYKSDIVKQYTTWGRPPPKQENWLQKIASESSKLDPNAKPSHSLLKPANDQNGETALDMTKDSKDRESDSSFYDTQSEDLVNSTSAAISTLAALTEKTHTTPLSFSKKEQLRVEEIESGNKGASALASLYAFAGAENPFGNSEGQVDMQKQAEKAIMQNFYTQSVGSEEENEGMKEDDEDLENILHHDQEATSGTRIAN